MPIQTHKREKEHTVEEIWANIMAAHYKGKRRHTRIQDWSIFRQQVVQGAILSVDIHTSLYHDQDTLAKVEGRCERNLLSNPGAKPSQQQVRALPRHHHMPGTGTPKLL